MAQLPPKAPAIVQKWSSFGYQTMPISVSQAPNWLDDFIDFASTRRNSHRRTSSDPITFVEMNECDNSNRSDPMIPCSNSNNGFECLDDEQISSMFTDDNVSTDFQPISSIIPCDQYSDNDETKTTSLQEQQMKNEPGEVEDAGCDYELERESESAKQHPLSFSSDGGTIVDPKRVKRILANRQSAQRSRVRKLHYISELERSVTNLQTEVSTLSPRVAYLDHQRLILNVDNSSLKQRIAALAQDKIFKDAHQEALRKEIERLRRVYNDQQNMNKHADNTTTGPMTSPSRPPQPPPTSMDEARASDHHGSDN